jgi:hypothetical protein
VRIFIVLLLAVFAAAGCATTDSGNTGPAIERSAKWVMLPVLNHTEVPQAGLRAERKVMIEAEKWARIQNARYAIYGAVDEWRYKVGIDGEPAVGVALHIIDLQSNAVVWSGVGGKSGWSRESLSGVAQKLIKRLLATAPVQ